MFEDNNKKSILYRLSSLVELFYGFAIANGLSDGIVGALKKADYFSWIFLVLAFLMSLGDWIAYHIYVSHLLYKRLSRLLLDLLGAVLIFCLLITPSVDHNENTHYSTIVVCIYFIFSCIYCLLLKIEDKDLPDSVLIINMISFFFALIATVFSFAYEIKDFKIVLLIDLLDLAAIGLWTSFNLNSVYKEMKNG